MTKATIIAHCPLCAGSLTLVWTAERGWLRAGARHAYVCESCEIEIVCHKMPKGTLHETKDDAVNESRKLLATRRKRMGMTGRDHSDAIDKSMHYVDAMDNNYQRVDWMSQKPRVRTRNVPKGK